MGAFIASVPPALILRWNRGSILDLLPQTVERRAKNGLENSSCRTSEEEGVTWGIVRSSGLILIGLFCAVGNNGELGAFSALWELQCRFLLGRIKNGDAQRCFGLFQL